MLKFLLSLTAGSCIALTACGSAKAGDWPMFGRTVTNLASNPTEKTITRDNVEGLAPKWVAKVGGDVSARAAVVEGIAYFPDWSGNVWALDASTGKVIWQHTLQSYGFAKGTVSRTSPAVVGDTIYIGTQAGAYMVALVKTTGALKWLSQMDDHPKAIITGSPAVENGVVYTGVSSTEESAAANPAYHCCSFRGSVIAVEAATGKILWKTFTVPAGYSGGSVWGSNPVVDIVRQEVFIGSGNNYSVPTDPAYTACISAGGKRADCTSPDDHFDSLLAFDIKTGHIKWSHRLGSPDDWNVDCLSVGGGQDNCPTGSGPDYDFASAPQEFNVKLSDGRTRTILGAGQKSGIYSAFDIDTHKMLWARQVGPGATLGGIEWGSATDGKRIYVAISNFDRKHYAGGTAGSWNALDPLTGVIEWQTPDPNGVPDLGPVAVANGVVFAASTAGGASQATMFALDGATGTVLWSFASGATVNAGATVVDGTVFWGSGYAELGIPGLTANNRFFAFSLSGK